MTPEERFERIEKTLERSARESHERFKRIETNFELLQDFMSQSAQRFEQRFEKVEAQLDQLGKTVTKVEAQLDRLGETVNKLADTVVSLVRVFDNHTRDGHGGKRKKG